MNTTQSPSVSSATGAYVPGVCNINQSEIAYRRKAGYLGLGIFIVLAAPLVLLDLPRFIRVLLFLPAFLAAIGFLQAHYKFCVGYGAAGMQNATDGDKEAQAIVDAAAKDLDKKRTRKINTQAALIAVLATVVVLLIPKL
jgi:hypothetical protein